MVRRSEWRGACRVPAAWPEPTGDAIPALPRRGATAASRHAIASTLGSVPDAGEINGIRSSARRLYRAIFQVAKQMVADDLLEASALDHFVFPLWFPTVDEACAPIRQEPDLKENFEIIDATGEPGPCPSQGRAGRFLALAILRETPASMPVISVDLANPACGPHLFGPSAKNGAEVDKITVEFFRRLTGSLPGRAGFACI